MNVFINVSYLQMKKHHHILYVSLMKAGSPAHPALWFSYSISMPKFSVPRKFFPTDAMLKQKIRLYPNLAVLSKLKV